MPAPSGRMRLASCSWMRRSVRNSASGSIAAPGGIQPASCCGDLRLVRAARAERCGEVRRSCSLHSNRACFDFQSTATLSLLFPKRACGPSAESAERRRHRAGAVRGSASGRPIMALLDLLGRRWALRVLWELREGPLQFRALQERCDGMSSSVLNDAARRAARGGDRGARGRRLRAQRRGRAPARGARAAAGLGRALGARRTDRG